jgi:phospholipid-binding lipoprotein MlaA
MRATTPPGPWLPIWLALCVALAGCATTGARTGGAGSAGADQAADSDDPLEPFNRAMFNFNDKLDRYFLKPVAKGYRAVVPSPARTGISNFFSNLHEPGVMVNDVLQGKFKHAASDLGRFLVNTTIGIYGLFDVATHFGLEQHNEDFGQTLGKWGVGSGPYLVLPFFGSSDFRDAPSLYVDYELYPPSHMEEQSTASKLYGVEIISTRAQLLEAGDILEQAAGQDPYIFVREAYRQRRRNLIQDGVQTEPAPLDPSIFEDEAPTPKPTEPGPPPPASRP